MAGRPKKSPIIKDTKINRAAKLCSEIYAALSVIEFRELKDLNVSIFSYLKNNGELTTLQFNSVSIYTIHKIVSDGAKEITVNVIYAPGKTHKITVRV